ncbi:MAG: class I SAM-dependent methyltransferase [Verrucomicrobia bacterium]|nr:class I SAM-dependent methyltransferase [Verrucomicrobiota bacterium]
MMISALRSHISFWRQAYRNECKRRILDQIHGISGLGDGAYVLQGVIRAEKPNVVVEIGSASGWSACVMGCAIKANGLGHLYAIDPHKITEWNDGKVHDTFPVMRHNLRKLGLDKIVTIIRKTSQDAACKWEQKIDLMFIDGDHSYEGVKKDWELFQPHFHYYTVVIFHDTIWEVGRVKEEFRRKDMGVPQFVEELRREGYPVVTLPGNFGLSIVQPVRGGYPLSLKN